MKAWQLSQVVFAWVVAFTCATTKSGTDAAGSAKLVHELTDESFDSHVAEGRWLVMFFAPWCGHCKHMYPAFNQAAQQVHGKMNFARVDATQATTTKSRFNVAGFPTLVYLEDGEKVANYDGDRTAKSLVAFEATMAAPLVFPCETIKEAEELMLHDSSVRQLEDNPVTMVLVTPKGSNPDSAKSALKLFKETATELRGRYVFAKTSSSEVLNWMLDVEDGQQETRKGLMEQVSMVRYEAGELPKLFALSDHGGAVKEMDEWVRDNTLPLFGEFSIHNFHLAVKNPRFIVIACVDPGTGKANNQNYNKNKQKEKEEYLAAVRAVARASNSDDKHALHSSFVFGHMDGLKFTQFLSQYNVKSDHLPRLLVLDSTNRVFYEDQELDQVENIELFLSKVLNGEIIAQSEGPMYRMLRKFMTFMPYSAIALVVFLLAALNACRYITSDDDFVDEAADPTLATGESNKQDNSDSQSSKKDK